MHTGGIYKGNNEKTLEILRRKETILTETQQKQLLGNMKRVGEITSINAQIIANSLLISTP